MWKPIPGYEQTYEVSDSGQVRRIGKGRGAVTGGRILKLTNHNAGYISVTLHMVNKPRTFLLHRLVMAAFVGPCPDGYEVNHRNGSKHDNTLENLEYMTRKENIGHAMATGLMRLAGESNPAAKLTIEKAATIREIHANTNRGYKSIAAEFGVTWEAIRNIVKGRVWRYAA